MAAADHILEDEANDGPGYEVDRVCGWDDARSGEDDWETEKPVRALLR